MLESAWQWRGDVNGGRAGVVEWWSCKKPNVRCTDLSWGSVGELFVVHRKDAPEVDRRVGLALLTAASPLAFPE